MESMDGCRAWRASPTRDSMDSCALYYSVPRMHSAFARWVPEGLGVGGRCGGWASLLEMRIGDAQASLLGDAQVVDDAAHHHALHRIRAPIANQMLPQCAPEKARGITSCLTGTTRRMRGMSTGKVRPRPFWVGYLRFAVHLLRRRAVNRKICLCQQI